MISFVRKCALIFVLIFSAQIFVCVQETYRRGDLWAKEIAAFTAADKKDFPKKGKILFVGSSSIRGWRTLKEDFPSIYTVNRGFGGSHFEDVNFYAPQIVFPYKPKLIVAYAGENDLTAGKSIETVFNDFKNFVSLIRKNLPKSRIIVISLKPSPARWDLASKFMELNDLIKKETERDSHLLFVDVWLPMLDERGEPKKDIFLGDKLHMNAAGYKIWRETLSPAIQAGIKGSFSKR